MTELSAGQHAGRILRDAREHLEITQADLARRSGLSQPAISRLESGAHEPRISTLRAYAEGLGGKLEVAIRFDRGAE